MKIDLPYIILDHISYSYPNGTKALKDISLNIYRGELIGIMGSNGAGKTTLIRTLNGLIRPQEGSIYIDGERISSKTIAELSKDVGIIFQNPDHQLFSNTVEEEIKFSLKNIYIDKIELNKKIKEILELFNFLRYRERSPLNLSGGEKKKLALASIICRDPELIIFDEPTLGQDEKEINFFIDLINKERKNGKTIIIVSHNIEFAFEYIPRIILMSNGKLIGDGPTHEILTNKDLVEKSSLELPQLYKLKDSLQKVGIALPDEIDTRNKIIEFLSNYLKFNSIGQESVN